MVNCVQLNIVLTWTVVYFQLVFCDSGLETFGHEVKLRAHAGLMTSPRSWVDSEVTVAEGCLSHFTVFLTNCSQQHAPTPTLSLQLWLPVVDLKLTSKYRLIYDQTVRICATTGLVNVKAETSFHVPKNSKLGWTFSGGFMPLTFDFDEHERVYFRTLVATDNASDSTFHRVTQTYRFDNMPYPAKFSLAVTTNTACRTPLKRYEFMRQTSDIDFEQNSTVIVSTENTDSLANSTIIARSESEKPSMLYWLEVRLTVIFFFCLLTLATMTICPILCMLYITNNMKNNSRVEPKPFPADKQLAKLSPGLCSEETSFIYTTVASLPNFDCITSPPCLTELNEENIGLH